MNTKKYILAVILGVALLIAAIQFLGPKEKEEGPFTEVIKVENGYGYQIVYEDRILVKQQFIPAVQGKKVFKTKNEAKLVADKVLKKIKKGEDPFITVSELNEMKITLSD